MGTTTAVPNQLMHLGADWYPVEPLTTQRTYEAGRSKGPARTMHAWFASSTDSATTSSTRLTRAPEPRM
jgi:hypothetical protein